MTAICGRLRPAVRSCYRRRPVPAGPCGYRRVPMTKSPSPSTGTTAAIRLAIRDSQESLRTLAKRYGIDPKTVAKWKKRESAVDLARGPKPGRHGKLTAEEESIIVRF